MLKTYTTLASIQHHTVPPPFLRGGGPKNPSNEKADLTAASVESFTPEMSKESSKECFSNSVLYELCVLGRRSPVASLLSQLELPTPSTISSLNSSVLLPATSDTVLSNEHKESVLNFTGNINGECALHAAVRKGLPDLVEILLYHGADPTLKNYNNLPPYSIAKVLLPLYCDGINLFTMTSLVFSCD